MTYVSEVTADTPLAWWRLGEASGTTAADSSGNSHPGTLSASGVTYNVTGAIAGDSNKALTFNGTTGAFSAAIDLSAQNKLTVEFWLNWTTYADDDRPVVEYTSNGKTTTGGFAITPNGNGIPGSGQFEVTVAGGGAAGFIRPLPGEFHHYVVEIDRTKYPADGGVNCWIDGVQQPRRWCTPLKPAQANFANSTLYAMARAGSSLFATGTLDELAVYGGLLSDARVVAHKVAGQPTHILDTYANEVTADTPRVWLRLGETTGTTAADSSGNSHPGTWSGTKTLGVTGIINGDANKAAQVAGAGAISCAVDLSDLNVLTLEFWWLWPSTPNVDQMVLEYTANGTGAGGFSFSNIGGTAHQWRVVMGGMTVEFAKPGAPFRAPSMDKWHHIVIRLDRAKAMSVTVPTFRHGFYAAADTQAVRLYVDSVRQRPTAVTGGTAVGGNFANSTLYLFSRNASSLFATGTMDEFAIYPAALHLDRIDCHYQAGTGLEWIHPGATQKSALRYKLWNASQQWVPNSLFSGSNIWEDTLPSDAPLHASSATWVANLKAQAQPTGPGGAHSFEYYNGTPPIYIVPPSQPGIPVANGEVIHPEVLAPWPRMFQVHEEFMAGVPFPEYAVVDGSSDQNVVTWKPSTNDYWEMWSSRPEKGIEPVASRAYEWSAYGGGHMRDTSISKGYYKDRFDGTGHKYEDRFDGTTATGLLFSGGVISYDEWNADSIPHVLHMVVGNANPAYYFPASRGDGHMDSSWIPEGGWVRLDPNYNVDAHFPPASAGGDYVSRKLNALCHAAQDHGILITDKTGQGVGLRFQSTYGALAEGDNFILEGNKTGSIVQLQDDIIMGALPWDFFQVLDPAWVAARWDEVPPQPTALETLVEDFAAGTISSAKWGATIGQVFAQDGQGHLQINHATAGVAILDADPVRYTLTGSQIAFEAVQIPSDVLHSEAALKLTSSAGFGNCYLTFIFSDNDLIADTRDGDAAFTARRLARVPYDPVAHRWWRIREAGGTVYFETSPDGANWNVFASVLWSLTSWPAENLNSMRVQFFTENYQAIPGARDFIIDNVNVAPVGGGGGSSDLASAIVGTTVTVVYPGGTEDGSFVGVTLE